ncbi:MAG TPA: hypothetical protein VEK56_11095 [Vicinamibacterales bacterium]|nr:hypothetical protein [Vicinamibacterales bacterium]
MRHPWSYSRITTALLFAAAALLLQASNAGAMPMFARKLGVPCATCHTTIPRLNETGYRFRAAGFRLPEEIGKEETKPFELGDYFSGRIQARYDASRAKIGPVSSHRSSIQFHELTAYPATGSWGKYFSSLVELSFAPEEPAEVENGYVRADQGNPTTFYSGRFGIFHPFEGFGASDRPLALSRPYFQTNAANFNQTTFFTPWGFDQAGVEGGIDYKRTSVRATVFSGLTLREEEGAIKAFPAQGGPLRKPGGLPSSDTVDFQVFANQILNADGGGVSAYYYHGRLDLPVAGAEDLFQNSFDRVALYGSYPVLPKLHLLAAIQQGRDHLVQGGTLTSRGYFVEADSPLHEYATAGVRYDWFDPSRNKADNQLRGVFAFLNVPLQNGLQFIAEYQNKKTFRGAQPDRTDNVFQIRLIFIQ